MTSGVYERVVRALSKAPQDRTDSEVDSLLPWFRKKSDLFSDMKTDVVIDIIRNCDFVTHERDYPLIKQGETGDCFFILLRGKVSVYITHNIADEEDPEKIQEFINQLGVLDDKGELDRSKFGNFIVSLGSGKSFGELALINKNCIRNASIVTDETCDLVVVNRELYNRSLHAAQAAEFEQKNTFVRENPIFRPWQVKYKKQLAMSLRKEKIQYEGSIVNQGDPTNVLYFIVKGQAKIVVEPSQHSLQCPQFYPLEITDWLLTQSDSEDEDQIGPKKKDLPPPIVREEPVSVCPYLQRRREKPKKLVELSLVGINEVIGDTEFVLDLKTYLHTVVCTQNSEVFCLDRRNFDRLVARRNPSTLQLLRDGAEIKHHCRITRAHESKVPLLRTLLYKMQTMDKQAPGHGRSSGRKHGKPKNTLSASYDSFVPTRGALIDIYGPGTVFYRNRMREKAKRKLCESRRFRQETKEDQKKKESKSRLALLTQNLSAGEGQEMQILGAERGPLEKPDVFITKSEPGSDSETDDRPGGRPVHPSVYKDFKSSDLAMSVLEERIKSWHAAVTADLKEKNNNLQPFKLRRVNIEDGKELIPGSRVVLRKKKQGRVLFAEDFEGTSNVSNDWKAFSSSPFSTRAGHKSKPIRPMSVNDALHARFGPRLEGVTEQKPVKKTVHRRGLPSFKDPSPNEATTADGIPISLSLDPRTLSDNGFTMDGFSDDDGSDLSELDRSALGYRGTILEVLRHRQKMATDKWRRKTQDSKLSPTLIHALKPSDAQSDYLKLPNLSVNDSNPRRQKRQRRNSADSDSALPHVAMAPRRFSLVGAASGAASPVKVAA